MLVVFGSVARDDGADHLPVVQSVQNTANNRTLWDMPHHLVFGRGSMLPMKLFYFMVARTAPQFTHRTTKIFNCLPKSLAAIFISMSIIKPHAMRLSHFLNSKL